MGVEEGLAMASKILQRAGIEVLDPDYTEAAESAVEFPGKFLTLEDLEGLGVIRRKDEKVS